jgi:ubiquinone/menaquinone biosynthesis C-methylase UbiE
MHLSVRRLQERSAARAPFRWERGWRAQTIFAAAWSPPSAGEVGGMRYLSTWINRYCGGMVVRAYIRSRLRLLEVHAAGDEIRVRNVADHMASIYDGQRRHTSDVLATIVNRLITSMLPERSRVLDLGTGAGAMLPHLVSARFSSVVAADLSPAMISSAARKRASSVAFVVADGHRLPFRENSFDLITSVSCWHLFDKPKTIIEAGRVVKDKSGGLLIVDPTPEQLAYQTIHRLFPQFHEYERRRHSSVREIAVLARMSGFKIQSLNTDSFELYFASPEALIEFVSAKPYFGMRTMSEQEFTRGFKVFAHAAQRMPRVPIIDEVHITSILLCRSRPIL